MADANKPIPKSLHTVTVFVKLTQHFAQADEQPLEDALERTLNVLGYDETARRSSTPAPRPRSSF